MEAFTRPIRVGGTRPDIGIGTIPRVGVMVGTVGTITRGQGLKAQALRLPPPPPLQP
jgi:hypothetical protein